MSIASRLGQVSSDLAVGALFACIANSPAYAADPVDFPAGKVRKDWCAISENGKWALNPNGPDLSTEACSLKSVRIWTDCGDPGDVSSVFRREIRALLTLESNLCENGGECGMVVGEFDREAPYVLRQSLDDQFSFASFYFPGEWTEGGEDSLLVVFSYDDQDEYRQCLGNFVREN